VDIHRPPPDVAELTRDLADREKTIAMLRGLVAGLEGQIAALQSTLVNYASENELLRRKVYGPRSERGGTSELQLALGNLMDQQVALQKELDELVGKSDEKPASTPPPPPSDRPKATPKGRRDLSLSKLPVTTVTIEDPALAAQGKLIGFDETRRLMRQRGCFKVLLQRIAKYEITVGEKKTVLGVEAPLVAIPRGMLHSSLLAYLAVQKFALGVPHHRLEQQIASEGEDLDRSVMCRNMEEVGSLLGSTVVHAMTRDAMSCNVLSTDATGAAIQPGKRNGGPKQACKNGHFFTIVADRDHVLFTYTEKHDQEAVARIFEGFRGYLQSDASSVYHVLERGPPKEGEGVTLVGCWAHARRYFFEAAICKYAIGLEGLTRIRAIYVADEKLANLPPGARKEERARTVAPLMESFFAWVRDAQKTVPGRNLASKALGYATNQEHELRRVLDDGRLPLDNNRSERALRKVVVGRKNWLFYGSDLHAQAAAAIFSIIASCRLHGIEPELYLDELLRVLPYWPDSRYLELAPKNWAATRATLDDGELAVPVGVITVPPPPLGLAARPH
jgi:transposase